MQEGDTAWVEGVELGQQRLCVEDTEGPSLHQPGCGWLRGGCFSRIPVSGLSGPDVAQKGKSPVNQQQNQSSKLVPPSPGLSVWGVCVGGWGRNVGRGAGRMKSRNNRLHRNDNDILT